MKLIEGCWAPLFWLGFIGTAVLLVAANVSLMWLVALLGLAITVSFLLEQVIPYEPNWNSNHGDRFRDWLHAVVNETANALTVSLIPILAIMRPWDGIWPSDFPLWLQLALAIIVADCGITLAHWASHKLNWLWRFHAVHHSVKRMYGLNGLMKHPLHQAIETVAGTLPLLLAGLPVEIGALLAFAVAIQLLLQHSNARMRLGPLRWVWAVAPLHRFHHNNAAGEGDVNFGLFTTAWDRLLGTAVDEPDRRFYPGELGLSNNETYPSNWWAQMQEPFRSSTQAKNTT